MGEVKEAGLCASAAIASSEVSSVAFESQSQKVEQVARQRVRVSVGRCDLRQTLGGQPQP